MIKIEDNQVAEAQINETQFLKLLAMITPDLYLIYRVVEDNQINMAVVPPILKSLGKLAHENPWGQCVIVLNEGKIINIIGRGSILINLPCLYFKNKVDKPEK